MLVGHDVFFMSYYSILSIYFSKALISAWLYLSMFGPRNNIFLLDSWCCSYIWIWCKKYQYQRQSSRRDYATLKELMPLFWYRSMTQRFWGNELREHFLFFCLSLIHELLYGTNNSTIRYTSDIFSYFNYEFFNDHIFYQLISLFLARPTSEVDNIPHACLIYKDFIYIVGFFKSVIKYGIYHRIVW